MKLLITSARFFVLIIIISCFNNSGLVLSAENRENKTITLEEAIEIALKNNRSLKRTELQLSSAELSVNTSKDELNLKIRPSTEFGYVDGSEYWVGGIELYKKHTLGFTSSITPQIEHDDEGYQSSLKFSLNVPLLKGVGPDYSLDALKSTLYELENAKQSYYSDQVSTVIDTVSAVYDVIKYQQQIDMLRKQQQLLQGHIALTKMKQKTGLATAMDLYRAQIRIKEIQNELTTVQELLANGIDQLKDLLSADLSGMLTVTAPVYYQPLQTPLDEAVQTAMNNRIELDQVNRRIMESERKYILAKKNILPQLDLNLDYSKHGANSSFDLDEEDVSITFSGSTDIFRTQERAAFEQAKIDLKSTQMDLEEMKIAIVREVRTQINRMEKKKKLIADRHEQLRQAQGKLKLAHSKFNHDLTDNFDLLESQTQVQEVQLDLLADTVDYIVDTYRLRKTLGTLIER